MDFEERIKKFNEDLNGIPPEEFIARDNEQREKDEKDFQELKEALAEDRCSYCGNHTSQFSEKKFLIYSCLQT